MLAILQWFFLLINCGFLSINAAKTEYDWDQCETVIFTGKKDYYTSKIHNAQLHAINVKYTRLS